MTDINTKVACRCFFSGDNAMKLAQTESLANVSDDRKSKSPAYLA